MPETLTLPKVESIDVQAFCEAELVQTSQGLQFVPVNFAYLVGERNVLQFFAEFKRAFAYCFNLGQTYRFKIHDGVFYGCSSLNLAAFDFDNITKVGKMSFLGTQMPETLTLLFVDVYKTPLSSITLLNVTSNTFCPFTVA